MKLFKQRPLLIVLFAAISFVGLGFAEDYARSTDAEDQAKLLEIGQKAPDLAYTSPDGKVLKLSDLRGKVVLIDFWASWCRPCRAANPSLVATYEKYKDANFKNGKGFTVYSVSLDQNKNHWTEAIAKDKLSWDYHVSDLKGWKSEPAQKYNVNSIPATFLIDSEGTILAKNLDGNSLGRVLEKLKK